MWLYTRKVCNWLADAVMKLGTVGVIYHYARKSTNNNFSNNCYISIQGHLKQLLIIRKIVSYENCMVLSREVKIFYAR